MSSNKKNKSKSTGIRILWIPGRKQNNHKGQCSATNKRIDYSKRQKRNETWSLGGSKTQHDILKSSLPETPDVSGPSLLLPTAYAAGAVVNLPEEKMKFENDSNRFAVLGDVEDIPHENTDDTAQISSLRDGAGARAPISPIKETKRHTNNFKEDVDSIEYLAENGTTTQKDPDAIDGNVFGDRRLSITKQKKQKKKKKKAKNNEDSDEKTVKCLYFALMCCECTIS